MSILPYNIEIFGRDYSFKQNYVLDDIDYKFDYMSITENSVIIPYNSSVKKGDYIRLKNDERTFYGIITTISVDQSIEGFTNIGYKPLISLFDVQMVINIIQQGVNSVESFLASYITSYFVNNSDSSQNISGLIVNPVSSTSPWTFYLVEDNESGDNTIVNFMDLIRLALTKYEVVVNFVPDFGNHTITCNIGTSSIGSFIIEADLPNVYDKNIIFNQNKSDVNKLVVLDTASDYSSKEIYYLHNDDTYDQTDSDRVLPVIYSIQTTAASGGKTFADAALELANKQFGNENKANNLIELWINKNDTMVSPTDMEVGQWVTIIANGTSYLSLFTGYEIGEKMKLIFGTIRLDLTKILKRRL